MYWRGRVTYVKRYRNITFGTSLIYENVTFKFTIFGIKLRQIPSMCDWNRRLRLTMTLNDMAASVYFAVLILIAYFNFWSEKNSAINIVLSKPSTPCQKFTIIIHVHRVEWIESIVVYRTNKMTGLTVTVRRILARNSDEYVRLLHLLRQSTSLQATIMPCNLYRFIGH